jgi:hypothetical protein
MVKMTSGGICRGRMIKTSAEGSVTWRNETVRRHSTTSILYTTYRPKELYMVRAPAQCRFYDLGECSVDSWLERYGVKAASNDPRIYWLNSYRTNPLCHATCTII